MSYAKTLSKLESSIEDVSQVNYTICEATINHCDQIFNLVQEYYTEYGIPKNRQLNISTFRRDGFETSSPCFRCFIALTKTRGGIDEIIGFVLWYRSFGSTTGPRVYLEALFVTKPYRQKQVEQALFEETLQEGEKLNYSNVNWIDKRSYLTEEFYTNIGGENLTKTQTFLLYKLDEKAISAIALPLTK